MSLSLRLAVAFAAAILIGLPSASNSAPPSAADFTRAAALDDVSISRDGKHIVGLTSPDGAAVTISVWRTDTPERAPAVLGSAHMRFLGVRFLKNDRLLVEA